MTAPEPLDLGACVENLNAFAAQGDARSCRDIALAAIRELESVRRDLVANEGSEDARLAIAEANVKRLESMLADAKYTVGQVLQGRDAAYAEAERLRIKAGNWESFAKDWKAQAEASQADLNEVCAEVERLRALCDAAGVQW